MRLASFGVLWISRLQMDGNVYCWSLLLPCVMDDKAPCGKRIDPLRSGIYVKCLLSVSCTFDSILNGRITSLILLSKIFSQCPTSKSSTTSHPASVISFLTWHRCHGRSRSHSSKSLVSVKAPWGPRTPSNSASHNKSGHFWGPCLRRHLNRLPARFYCKLPKTGISLHFVDAPKIHQKKRLN